MATVNFIKCKNQNRASMKGTLDYVMQKYKVAVKRENLEKTHAQTYADMHEEIRKTQNYDDCIELVSGKDCCPETVNNEFMATRKTFDKTNGVFFYHYDQSFKADENIPPKTAHEIAMKFAEDNYPGYEVLVATHMDKAHIHSHFIINSVSFEDGKKLHQNKETLKKLRACSDEICKSYGLSTTTPSGTTSFFDKYFVVFQIII